jgi:GntR family transcriptional repressor for pyruvate dehydrogenase complex
VALGSFPLEDVVDTRVALERASVVLACRNARPQDLARMRAALVAMDESEVDRETFNQLDTDFHVALADAGGNRLMSDVTRAIRESVRAPILTAMTAMPETGNRGWPRILNGLRADHHAIFTAVEAGQAEQAADLVESHIRGFSSHMTNPH